MSYEDALKDLRAEFGKKLMLTTEDIAPYIGRSANAQRVLKSRKRFPIPQKRLGGHNVMSIYALAHYIGDDSEPEAAKPSIQAKPAKARRSRTSNETPDPKRPTRRPPSLASAISAFRRQIEETARQLEFQRDLLTKLEAIDFDRDIMKHRKNRPLAPSKPKDFRC